MKDDSLLDVAGPLGNPSELVEGGTVVCIGGGIGIAPIYPIAREMKAHGNKVITIIGARSADYLFWEDKLGAVSDELHIATDDGSKGIKGFVTMPLAGPDEVRQRRSTASSPSDRLS